MSGAAEGAQPGPRKVGGVQRKRKPGDELPKGCPVTPLGYGEKGSALHMLDWQQRYVTVPGDGIFRRGPIENLFGPNIGWLCENYPKRLYDRQTGRRVVKEGEYDLTAVARALIRANGALPLFDPLWVRGNGAWPSNETENGLIHNTGAAVLVWSKGGPAQKLPGWCGDCVYPAGPVLPALSYRPAADGGGYAATAVLEALRAWHFAGGTLDHRLLLGWIGQVFIGGALRRRTCAVVSGEHASGKTTLLDLLGMLCGPWLQKTSDATVAGVIQLLAGGACGVLVDEAEAENHQMRQTNNVHMRRLLRISYDGGEVWRGGVDQVGMRARFRSPVMIAAISPPPLDAPERSRTVMLNLTGRPVGEYPADLFRRAPELGVELGGRISAAFGRLVDEEMPAYRRLLIELGWDSRGAETVGQLLAIGALLVARHRPAAEVCEEFAGALAALCEAQAAGRIPRWQLFLSLLRGLLIEPEKAGEKRRTLGDLIREAAGFGRFEVLGADRLSVLRSVEREKDAQRVALEDETALEAQRRLAHLGLRIATAGSDVGDHIREGERVMLFANQSPMLAELVRRTSFADLATGIGSWSHCLMQAPAAAHWGPARFPFGFQRAVALPLELVLAGMVGEDAEGTAAAWEGFDDR